VNVVNAGGIYTRAEGGLRRASPYNESRYTGGTACTSRKKWYVRHQTRANLVAEYEIFEEKRRTPMARAKEAQTYGSTQQRGRRVPRERSLYRQRAYTAQCALRRDVPRVDVYARERRVRYTQATVHVHVCRTEIANPSNAISECAAEKEPDYAARMSQTNQRVPNATVEPAAPQAATARVRTAGRFRPDQKGANRVGNVSTRAPRERSICVRYAAAAAVCATACSAQAQAVRARRIEISHGRKWVRCGSKSMRRR